MRAGKLEEPTRRWRLVAPVLLLGACLALLPSLGSSFLWQDEAQTALLARTVLERGLPYGYDGRNYFSQELGAEYGQDFVWKWHTWLSFYAVALSFQLLGATTEAARLPFVLFGVGTILLSYRFARGLWQDRRAGLYAALLLLGCVPFLLLSRQARYYAPAAFFALLGLECYRLELEGRKGALAGFVAAATLLFHTHYLYFATLLASVGAHVAIFHRDRLARVLGGCGVAVLLCGPWMVWLSGIRYGERYADSLLDLSAGLDRLSSFASQLVTHVLPVSVVALALIAVLVGRLSRRAPIGVGPELGKAAALPVLFVAGTVLALASTAPAPFFRYLAPVIPPLLVLGGLLASLAHRSLHAVAGVAVVATFLALQPLQDYVWELTHDYEGPVERLVGFLEANAEADDIVAITYGDLPLKFYTDLRVVGGLTGEDLTPARAARWVVLRRHAISAKDVAVRDYLVRNLPLRSFRPIPLDIPDIPFENRESPDGHRYRTPEQGPPLVVLERPRG